MSISIEHKNVTIGQLNSAFSRVCEPEPDLIVCHPTQYRRLMNFCATAELSDEIDKDEKLRAVWMAGWNARSRGRYNEQRRMAAWLAWCWQEALARLKRRQKWHDAGTERTDF
mgnify:CR=1 FL=1